MRLIVGATLFGILLFSSTITGVLVQPWAGWYFPGSRGVTPGQVPVAAQPLGPPRAAPDGLTSAVSSWIGVRYLFGGCSKNGVDCSCFVQITARELGVSLPRTAESQWQATARTNDPQPGDLVFFKHTYCNPGDCPTITHVGWYIGDGWMISAAEPAVGRQSLASGFWRTHLAGYGRLGRN